MYRLHELALSSIKGLSASVREDIISKLGSVKTFFESDAHELRQLFPAIGNAADKTVREQALDDARVIAEFNDQHGVSTIFPFDSDYPPRLLQCPDAPSRLFCMGQPPAPYSPVISIVGTRHATQYGSSFIENFIAELAETVPDIIIVSGLAYGIDIIAHRAAVKYGLRTVAVLANGLKTIYPAQHRKDAVDIINSGGALLTEYSPPTPAMRNYFLARNRIVAGMSDATIVVESAFKGGALVTTRLAREYGRTVMAVPGRLNDTYSEGCNNLIASGKALMLRKVDDLLNATGWVPQKPPTPQKALFTATTPQQQKVIDLLRLRGDSHIDIIAEALGMKIHEAASLLIDMDFDGIVTTLPGSRYSLII